MTCVCMCTILILKYFMTSNKFLYLKCHFTLLSSLYRIACIGSSIFLCVCVLTYIYKTQDNDDGRKRAKHKYFMTNILLLYIKEFTNVYFIIQFSLF